MEGWRVTHLTGQKSASEFSSKKRISTLPPSLCYTPLIVSAHHPGQETSVHCPKLKSLTVRSVGQLPNPLVETVRWSGANNRFGRASRVVRAVTGKTRASANQLSQLILSGQVVAICPLSASSPHFLLLDGLIGLCLPSGFFCPIEGRKTFLH